MVPLRNVASTRGNTEAGFIIAKLLRIGLLYLSSLIIQIYLVSRFPPDVNSTYQVILKWISIAQLLFVSGYGYLALNFSTRPIDLRFIWKHYKYYQIFNACCSVISIFILYILQYLCILGYNFTHEAVIIILLALSSGSSAEVSAFRYAEGDYVRYEVGAIAASCLSIILLCVTITSLRHVSNVWQLPALYLPIASVLPLSAYNFCYILFPGTTDSLVSPKVCLANVTASAARIFKYFRLSNIVHCFNLTGFGGKRIFLKAKSFQALQLVAALSWGTDLLIIGTLGTSTEVNHSSLTMSLFAISSTIVSIYSQRLQILYSEKAANRITYSILGPKLSHCLLSILPSVVILLLLLLLQPLFPALLQPFGGYTLIVSIALSVLLSNIGSIQGIYLNAANLPGRQVIANLFIVIPLNIYLSIKLISIWHAPGVFVATIISLLLSITINTKAINMYCKAKVF